MYNLHRKSTIIMASLCFSLGCTLASASIEEATVLTEGTGILAADHGPLPIAPIHIEVDPSRQYDAGVIVVKLHVDADGKVDPRSISTLDQRSSKTGELSELTLLAARSWRFQPAVHKGHKVASDLVYPITYSKGIRIGQVVAPTYAIGAENTTRTGTEMAKQGRGTDSRSQFLERTDRPMRLPLGPSVGGKVAPRVL
ncbi:MAG: energy transducer TonB [Dokdonella sp.]